MRPLGLSWQNPDSGWTALYAALTSDRVDALWLGVDEMHRAVSIGSGLPARASATALQDTSSPVSAFATIKGSSGWALPLVYSDSSFRSDRAALRHLTQGQQLLVTAPGSPVWIVRVDSAAMEPQDPTFPSFAVVPSLPQATRIALAWTPGHQLSVLAPDTVPAPSDLWDEIPRVVDSLWRSALTELRPDAVDGPPKLGTPTVLALPGRTSTLLVLVPVSFRRYGELDDRGRVFMVYSPSTRRVRYAVFGHPEWAPVNNSHLLLVIPYLFFQIRGDSRTYFFGSRMGSWESLDDAIFDAETGRQVVPDGDRQSLRPPN